MTAKNPVLGSCPCPVANCKEAAEVRRFSSKHTRDSGRRFAGKFYVDCPIHGRFGADVKPGFQAWIRENATMKEGAELDATPPAPPKAAPSVPASQPAKQENAAPPPPRRSGFGFFK